jgi:DnaK suppressor protein
MFGNGMYRIFGSIGGRMICVRGRILSKKRDLFILLSLHSEQGLLFRRPFSGTGYFFLDKIEKQINIQPLFINSRKVFSERMMKEKVESGKIGPGRKEIMAMRATEILTREIEGATGRSGFHEIFMERLMLKKEEIEKAINGLINGRKELKGLFSADEITEEMDRAEVEVATQVHYSLLEKKTKQLENIEILIRRVLKEEEFGLCDECGARIPEERLLIIPEATRCVPCQKEIERFESGIRLGMGTSSKRFSHMTNGTQSEDNEDFCDEDAFSIFEFEETDLAEYLAEENDE